MITIIYELVLLQISMSYSPSPSSSSPLLSISFVLTCWATLLSQGGQRHGIFIFLYFAQTGLKFGGVFSLKHWFFFMLFFLCFKDTFPTSSTTTNSSIHHQVMTQKNEAIKAHLLQKLGWKFIDNIREMMQLEHNSPFLPAGTWQSVCSARFPRGNQPPQQGAASPHGLE